MKCKDCGAHLPYGAYGHIRCEFCNTPNYVPIPGEKPEAEGKKEAKKEPAIKKDIKKGSSIKGLIKNIIIIGILLLAVLVIIGMMVTPSPDPPKYTYTPKPTYYTPTTTRPLTTTTPPPTTTAPSVPIISDSFNSNVNGWLMGSRSDDYATIEWSLINGKYRWDVKAHKGVNWHVYPTNIETFSDLHLTVEAQQISGAENAAYGAVFRLIDGDNFYYFTINNQKYKFALQYKDEWISLVDWTTSSAIQPWGVNKIEVIAEGPYFSFWINDQFITDSYDARLSSGKTGLAIELYNSGDTGIFEFDNFEVSDISLPVIIPVPTTESPILAYDAIDLVPYSIEGYTTKEREKNTDSQKDLGVEDNCGRTSAAASYMKNDDTGGMLIVIECDSEADAKNGVVEAVQYLEKNESASLREEIAIADKVNVRWGWMESGGERGTVFIWHQNNFMMLIAGVAEKGGDPYDVGYHITKNVILQSPL